MSSTAAKPTPVHTRLDVFAQEQPANHAWRWWVLAILAVAQLMVVLDATVVNIALPKAQADLGFSVRDRQWVVTAYALAFGSLLLLGGRLGDLFGRRRMFLVGLTGFAVTSAVAGAANGFGVLVAARAGQGIFGALLAPAGLALLTTTFQDPQERSKAFALYGAVSGAAGGVGLLLGGALTEYLNWRWCLYINLVFAAVAAVGAVLWIARDSTNTRPALDLPGTATVTSGLFALVYGASNAQTDGWSDPSTLAWLGAGVVLLALFVAIESRVAQPLLPLRILADRNRSGGLIALLSVGAGLFAIFLFLTYYLESSLGYSPVKTGLAYMPMIAMLITAAQLSAMLLDRAGARIPVVGGLTLAAVGLALLSRATLDSSYVTGILPGLLVTGFGAGSVFGPSLQAAVSGVHRDDASVASALTTTMQQIGGSLGTSVLSTFAATAAVDYLYTHGATPGDQALAAIHSYTTAFGWGAGIFAGGAVLCALLLRSGTLPAAAHGTVVVAH